MFEKAYTRLEQTPVSEMNDIIRYTEIQSSEDLASGWERTLECLENERYKILKSKNYWLNESNPYNGINVQIEAPNEKRLFISWSGTSGEKVANLIYEWIGEIYKNVEDNVFLVWLHN